jgi:ADP-heptose:LPS heptosyltransferase
VKILIVRFSSIGDIVLTTPVVRCIKAQLPDVELHFLTKQRFKSVIAQNPYLDRIHYIQDSLKDVVPVLRAENFDAVVDLHNNLRTLQLKIALGKRSYTFDKLNLEKFLMVQFKFDKLPTKHIVDRYFDAIAPLGVINDNKGLDYFIAPQDEIDPQTYLPVAFHAGYHALVAGGSYFTKRIPQNKLAEICERSDKPLVILGGPEDAAVASSVENQFPGKVLNLCGRINLNQSASLVKQATIVISSDTGLMHMAAAFRKPLVSVWGNTIPEFGMYPYLPGEGSRILEVKELSCRPCSKLGYKKCPKGHFKCMNEIDTSSIF